MTDTTLSTDFASDARKQANLLRSAVRGLRGRVRRSILVEGLGMFARSFAIFALGSFILDRSFRLDPVTRGVLLGAWLLWILFHLYRDVLLPMQTELDDEELVLAVERTDKQLGQRLISALQFSEALERGGYSDSSPSLMAHVIGELPQLLGQVDVRPAIKRERVRKQGLNFAGAVVLFGVAGFVVPQTLHIWAQRNLYFMFIEEPDWPRDTLLSVQGAEEGYLVVPRGDEFTVTVEAGGIVPEQVRIRYRFESGGSTTESMKQNTGENTFSFTFPGLLDPVTFTAFGGDGLTPDIEVRLVDRPVLEDMQLTLRYPAYMDREPLPVGPRATELLVPEGSVLELAGRASKELESAQLAMDGRAVGPAQIAGDGRAVSGSFVPETSGIFEVLMIDTHAMAQGEGRKLFLRVVPDKAPRVDVSHTGIGTMITPMARLPMDLRVRDDFGVLSIETLWGIGERADFGEGKDPDEVYEKRDSTGLEAFEPGMQNFEGRAIFDLQPLLQNADQLEDPANRVRPGLLVFLRHRARDEYPHPEGKGARASYGDRQTFRVVTPQELLQDLLRRQGQQRRELEQIREKHRRDSADFGDLGSPRTEGELGTQIRRKYRQLTRHQRHLARQVLTVARRYGLILDELRNNRLAEESVVLRRMAQIVDPLESLGNTAMPSLASLLSVYARSDDAELRAEAAQQYDEVRRMMDRVLKAMTELETFTTLLNQVRDLIQLENKILEKTKKKLAEDLDEFGFGPEEGEPSGKDQQQDPDKKDPKKQDDGAKPEERK